MISTFLNPFIPEFHKWTYPPLNLDTSIILNGEISFDIKQNSK